MAESGAGGGQESRRRARAVVCVAPDLLQPIRIVLAGSGFDVAVATERVIDVITEVADHAPDVVVIDVALVGRLGLRIFRVVETVSETCRTVALSPLDHLGAAAVDAGATIAVPYEDLSALRDLLARIPRPAASAASPPYAPGVPSGSRGIQSANASSS